MITCGHWSICRRAEGGIRRSTGTAASTSATCCTINGASGSRASTPSIDSSSQVDSGRPSTPAAVSLMTPARIASRLLRASHSNNGSSTTCSTRRARWLPLSAAA
ncbi:hypothetical protein D3C71_1609530 [compost metagenome]